jgi:opacity protein-like surface antigen
MSKRWVMVAGALLLLCAAPPAVMAAAESMVTVTLGHQSPTGLFSDGKFKDVAKPGVMAGFSAGYRVTRWLATGVDINYFRSPGAHDGDQFEIFEPSTEKIVTITLAEDWAITELGMYAKAFVFERGRVAPYVRAGAGAYSIRYSQDVAASSAGTTLGGSDQASKFGFSGGVGVRMGIVGGTTLGVETLYHRILARDTDVSLLTTGLMIGFGPTGN